MIYLWHWNMFGDPLLFKNIHDQLLSDLTTHHLRFAVRERQTVSKPGCDPDMQAQKSVEESWARSGSWPWTRRRLFGPGCWSSVGQMVLFRLAQNTLLLSRNSHQPFTKRKWKWSPVTEFVWTMMCSIPVLSLHCLHWGREFKTDWNVSMVKVNTGHFVVTAHKDRELMSSRGETLSISISFYCVCNYLEPLTMTV